MTKIIDSINSQADILSFFNKIEDATKIYRQLGNGRFNFGSSQPHYDQNQSEAEGFLRMLWGAGPREQNAFDHDRFDFYAQGIINGTNPQSQYYWGPINDRDQFMVELAALCMTLIETKDHFFDQLPLQQQNNIVTWISQINEHIVNPNNWLFFRILTNVTLKRLNQPFSQTRLDDDLKTINSFYVAKGWYFDGQPSQQDYYIGWAFHYYGLLYAHYMREDDPEQSQIFIDRAKSYAQTFVQNFDQETGAGIAFGRSLTYKFAEIAFWTMLVYTGVEALPWGQIKHIIFQCLRYWNTTDILRTDGVMAQGYRYDNQFMTEHYNGMGSRLWAMKVFILLAVPSEHPFWQSTETLVPLAEQIAIPEAQILATSQDGTNVQIFPVGQYTSQLHAADKYSKFVYSSYFGFSVQRGSIGLEQGAFDNVLAISPAGFNHYQPKELDHGNFMTDEYVTYDWSAYPGVEVKSFIVPCGAWHVRIHIIDTQIDIDYADGGFAFPEINSHASDHIAYVETDNQIVFKNDELTSLATTYSAGQVAHITATPDTNLLFQHTTIPSILGSLTKGRHVVVNAFMGDKAVNLEHQLSKKPLVIYSDHHATIIVAARKINLDF